MVARPLLADIAQLHSLGMTAEMADPWVEAVVADPVSTAMKLLVLNGANLAAGFGANSVLATRFLSGYYLFLWRAHAPQLAAQSAVDERAARLHRRRIHWLD